MKQRHYSDFFRVPDDYRANMDRETINKTPDTWLDFYPHEKFLEFLLTLFDGLKNGSKSVWLTGNYGTGKSNAALVTQKLYMDTEERVKRWFDNYKKELANHESLVKELFLHRKEGTLVVYDYNASGVGPNEDFLVRLEKGIIAAMNEYGMKVPAKANLNAIVDRLQREGEHFFATRDSIQDELVYLTPNIKTVEQLVEMLKNYSRKDTPNELLSDIQKVLHTDKIYLDIEVNTFRKWISSILSINRLKRVVYIFDEFSEFIDANKDQLKTFEEVSENPGTNDFFLVPVTHLNINAFWSENSAGAKKARDRFHFRNLEMPNDTAFRLAAHAMKSNPKTSDEWKHERDELWNPVASISDQFSPGDVRRDSFFAILPIHPMAAYLLKFLSEKARSNQRSIFEYLKGSADGREFQEFIHAGGPEVENKQYLTVDYLWKYFIERRDELGLDKEISTIRSEYERIIAREFSNRTEDDEEIRVLKTVLLFCLLSRLAPGGPERLQPTVQNIELSFQGDNIVDVRRLVKNLAEKHCFSVVNDNIELFTTSVGGVELQNKIAECENQFHELLSKKVEEMLIEYTKSMRAANSSNRFEIRVSDVNHTSLTYITQSVRDKYSRSQNKDNGTVCLWFVIARNKAEELLIPDKVKSILTQLRDHRILMFSFPKLTFCESNADLWEEYTKQYAQYILENDGAAKEQIKRSFTRLEREWFDKLKVQTHNINVYEAVNGKISASDTTWGHFKDLIFAYVRKSLPYCVDYLTSQITAFGSSGLRAWALAGIQFDAASGQYKQLVNGFKNQGITSDSEWFSLNPEHSLSVIHALFEKKIMNTIGKGTNLSVRKVYIELQRAPYGMRYNVLSAFVLGFVLRDLLTKNYQWTNEQMSNPLDSESLAEIIESVVKDDGQDKIKGEKFICKLSKAEKEFINSAPKMFGGVPLHLTTVEGALLYIQNRVEQLSGRVPLWILPEYIHSTGDSQAENIESVLSKICTAGRTSSKGATEQRSNAVKEIGAIILEAPNLIDEIASYMKTEYFIEAFRIYVDKQSPSLPKKAFLLGDDTHCYCQSILDKVAPTAGLLWQSADISKEIDETLKEYEIIQLSRQLLSSDQFIPYERVSDALRIAVTQTNKLPKSMLEAEYPTLSRLLSCFQDKISVYEIKDSLSQNMDNIRKLFFDSSKKEVLRILRLHLNDVNISDENLRDILNGMSSMFFSEESVFINDIRSRIENNEKLLLIQNIHNGWERFSGAKTPSEWALTNKIPARLLLGALSEAEELIAAFEQPENYALPRLNALLDILNEISPIAIADCQKEFLLETVPSRYAKFELNLKSLLDFLRKEYGKQPNAWPVRPDISAYIRDQYKDSIAPQIVEKIRKMPADDLKKKLLFLALENQDLGLLFWGNEE